MLCTDTKYLSGFTNDFFPTFISDLWCCDNPTVTCKFAYLAGFGSKLLTVPGFATVVKKHIDKNPQPGYQLGAIYSTFTAYFQKMENLVAIIEEQFLCHNSGMAGFSMKSLVTSPTTGEMGYITNGNSRPSSPAMSRPVFTEQMLQHLVLSAKVQLR